MNGCKTLDLKELRTLAEAATEGPWTTEDDGMDIGVIMDESGPRLGVAYICERFAQGESEGYADASYVAALDPPTVLALLDRLEEAEFRLDSLDK